MGKARGLGLTGPTSRTDAMQKKRRNGRASDTTSVEDELAHLRGLDLNGLRARWQSVFQRPAPSHLTRHLLFAVITYRIQADRFGDLEHATREVVDRTVTKEGGPAISARLASFDRQRTELTPGSVLVREWARQSQRVMVMPDGFAWNGQSYDSPSEIAGRYSRPEDRCHCCLQGRSSNEVAGGLRQAGRIVRRPRCLIRLGHAAVQHHDLDGAADPQCAFVLCPVRAGGHLGADPR